MTGSTNALDAKAAIKALVSDVPGPDFKTTWGFTRNPDRAWAYVGGVEWESTEWVTNRTQQETFNVKVVISIKQRKKTPEDVERAAVELGKLIQAEIKASPNLGLPAVVEASYQPKRMDSWPTDDFTEAQLEADIRVTARF